MSRLSSESFRTTERAFQPLRPPPPWPLPTRHHAHTSAAFTQTGLSGNARAFELQGGPVR